MYSKKHAKWPPQPAISPAAASNYSLSPFATHSAAAGILRSVDIHATARYIIAKCVSLCVCASVCRKVYCGKTAEWIRMPFGIMSGVSRMMGVLDGVVIVEGNGQFWE